MKRNRTAINLSLLVLLVLMMFEMTSPAHASSVEGMYVTITNTRTLQSVSNLHDAIVNGFIGDKVEIVLELPTKPYDQILTWTCSTPFGDCWITNSTVQIDGVSQEITQNVPFLVKANSETILSYKQEVKNMLWAIMPDRWLALSSNFLKDTNGNLYIGHAGVQAGNPTIEPHLIQTSARSVSVPFDLNFSAPEDGMLILLVEYAAPMQMESGLRCDPAVNGCDGISQSLIFNVKSGENHLSGTLEVLITADRMPRAQLLKPLDVGFIFKGATSDYTMTLWAPGKELVNFLPLTVFLPTIHS